MPLGYTFISIAIVGLIILSFVAFSGLRAFAKKHWFGFLVAALVLLSLIFNQTVASLLLPFAELSIIALGICILIGCINKNALKNAWRIGIISVLLILLPVILTKLPW